MAQRTIHLAMAKLISQEIKIKNRKRFEFGHILPDAVSNRENRDKSHYIKKGRYVVYDFQQFAKEYADKLLEDDLYLGYYMHLVEDVFFRKLFYAHNKKQDIGKNPEKVKVLHNDYHLLNSYIVDKFQLEDKIEIPSLFEKEEINHIADFSKIEEYLFQLHKDFNDCKNGQTVYFTENMLDEYMDKYLVKCVEEIKAVRYGASSLNVEDYSWRG